MKKTSTLIACLVAMGGMATAATLTITAAENTSFNYEGTLLGSAFSVTGGWYDVTLGLDYATIASEFIVAGSVAFPYAGNAAYNGYVSGTTGIFNADTLALSGRTIFWFVTDGATAYGLFEDTSKTFTAETAIPNTSTTVLNAISYPGFTQHVTADNSSVLSVGLVAIPEPSAALLGALGVLGLLRRRRN